VTTVLPQCLEVCDINNLINNFEDIREATLRQRRCNGICPPSKPEAGFPPERDFSPLWPREAVLPCPDPGPRPTRLRGFTALSDGCSVFNVVIIHSLV
jgi:hypothetical protein